VVVVVRQDGVEVRVEQAPVPRRVGGGDGRGEAAEPRRFTQAEGASYHCQPLARELTEQRMFDWMDEQIGR
jgi:hypothetical protein